MKLLLFDIDGTLLRTTGVGRHSLEQAILEVTGKPGDLDAIRFCGKTDPQIVREYLEVAGIEDGDSLIDEILTAYEQELPGRLLPESVEPLPGVLELIRLLDEHPDVQLGLVTGNLRPTAYLKLSAVGLAEFFPVGAFGSDHASRAELPALAVRRAEAHAQRPFRGKDVVIIGDTEHDISCGRGIGARSVAVCTGSYSRDELFACRPDHLLEDLTHPDAFMESIGIDPMPPEVLRRTA